VLRSGTGVVICLLKTIKRVTTLQLELNNPKSLDVCLHASRNNIASYTDPHKSTLNASLNHDKPWVHLWVGVQTPQWILLWTPKTA